MRDGADQLVNEEVMVPSTTRYCSFSSDRVWGYQYDPENRLVAAAVPGGSLRVDYRYDALGRQIERRTSGATVSTNRLYYAGWQLIAEYNGSGTLQRKYVYGPGIDEPVRMRFTGGVGTNYYYHADGLGSVTEITTGTGTKTESYSYDVYGTPTIYNAAGSVISTPSTGNRLLFTGRDRDPDTTLYNYRYRYYSPSLGRFVQVDPIGLRGGDINLYNYVKNRPVRAGDPYGLMSPACQALNAERLFLYSLQEMGIDVNDELLEVLLEMQELGCFNDDDDNGGNEAPCPVTPGATPVTITAPAAPISNLPFIPGYGPPQPVSPVAGPPASSPPPWVPVVIGIVVGAAIVVTVCWIVPPACAAAAPAAPVLAL